MYHAPRGKRFFLPWLTFHLGAGKKGFFIKGLFGEKKISDCRVLLDVSLPRQTSLRLGEEMVHLSEGMVFLGKGVRLGMGKYTYVIPRRGKRDTLVSLGEVLLA